ncbi:MAG: hypothetical protein PQJ58_12475 [Spirochaetales bacterium]|nr:hypothetical protein [Spirochaetales bacterium]
MYKKYNRILVTGLSQDISTQDLSEALEHIGHVISVNLEESVHKAVIEFESSEDAALALKVLRGFEFFGLDLHAEIVGPHPGKKYKKAS